MLGLLLHWMVLACFIFALILFYNYNRLGTMGKVLRNMSCGLFGRKRVKPARIRNSPKNPPAGYLGLRNEGSTCYLNSLLQCLFMTPDFTNGILGQPPSDTESIVHQLQDLFVKLQYGASPPSTRNLMRCLGICSGKQQDVEEHFRLLINKIPKDIQNLQLFHISVVHSITCQNCKQADDMPSTMLSLPLSIQMAEPSVDKALDGFLKEQRLDGDNCCYCDHCEEKQDAISRHYFKDLPPILVIHLKRYEICMGRFQKIHESVSTPHVLTVPFDKSRSEHSRGSDAEQKKLWKKNSEEKHKKKETVEYELFALCHHYGGLGGGHYAAEIKCFETEQWYTFNDEHVKKNSRLQDSTEKEKTSETAYLLMYRQKQLKPPKFMEKEDLPKHLQDMIDTSNKNYGVEDV